MANNKDTFYYFVEGECEEKLLNVFKENKNYIYSGRVEVFNAIQNKFTKMRIRTIPEKTIIVLVFDTDKKSTDILRQNINFLSGEKRFKKILCVTQVENLEDEIIRSTNLNHITDLTNSKSLGEFKSDFIREKRLITKLNNFAFDIKKLWAESPPAEFNFIENDSSFIKK